MHHILNPIHIFNAHKIGIIPALETSHAIYKAIELASQMESTKDVVVCVSGRGDKDVVSVAEALNAFGADIEWYVLFFVIGRRVD